MFEIFIAKRYLKARHKFNFITIINIISTVGITIGVAALIIVLAVFNGFGSLVTDTLLKFDPHIQIIYDGEPSKTAAVEQVLKNEKEVISFSPYADGRVILISGKTFEIVTLKGLTNYEEKRSEIKSSIVSSLSDEPNNKAPKLLLGLPLALKLSLRPGDTVSVLSTKELEKNAVTMSMPKIKQFTLDGLYEINNKEYAFSYALTDLKSAQATLGFDKVNGIEVYLNDVENAENVKKRLSGKLSDDYKIFTWYDLHKDLYNVMLLERWAAYILLSLIIAVAVFNILTSLTMSVLEKRKDIALLQTMGATKKSILRIFMYEGMLAGMIGTFTGTILGLGVVWLQSAYKIYSLDPMKYIIDALPVELRLSDIVAIAVMSLALSFFAALYPAKKSVKINLIESIKWE